MSSVFLSVFMMFLFITVLTLLAISSILNIYIAFGLFIVSTVAVMLMLGCVLYSGSRSKAITRDIGTKCTYNPFARAVEIHMNDEARLQILEKVDTGEYPGSALNDRGLLRKHYLDGIRAKLIKAFVAKHKVVIVAHSKSELNLLRHIPGSVTVDAGLFTSLAHTIGIRTYTLPKNCPKLYKPFLKLFGMFSSKYPIFWTEIQPSDEAVKWLENEYDAANFIN